jgi:hypothetical protein
MHWGDTMKIFLDTGDVEVVCKDSSLVTRATSDELSRLVLEKLVRMK